MALSLNNNSKKGPMKKVMKLVAVMAFTKTKTMIKCKYKCLDFTARFVQIGRLNGSNNLQRQGGARKTKEQSSLMMLSL